MVGQGDIDLPLFRDNTAAFIHEMPAESMSNVAAASNYIRVQVLTPFDVLDRDKQLGAVKELTEIVASAAEIRLTPSELGCFSPSRPKEAEVSADTRTRTPTSPLQLGEHSPSAVDPDPR